MQVISSSQALQQALRQQRSKGQRIGFVPTMGHLHAGHISLAKQVKEKCEYTVVSIFVNPTQFGPTEDYETYPRTLEQDKLLLAPHQVDLIFAPSASELYPDGIDHLTGVIPPLPLTTILCGLSRPQHFRGVATVVTKLFHIVQPDVAIFGEKDFQQLVIIRKMAKDLCFPIEILAGSTLRDSDGLALSSRNGYLSPEERTIAPLLYKTLAQVKEKIQQGQDDYQALCHEAQQKLSSYGFKPDYIEIRCTIDLSLPAKHEQDLVILAAAFLGKTRLIDNLKLY